MSSPDLGSESDILITFNVDKAVDCVVRWLQNSSIAQYFEDHPDARNTIVAAVQRLPRPETLSTPALTPCYTNLSNQQAPTPLTFQHDTQQLELINDTNADSSESKRISCNSQCSTDLDVSSSFDRNNEIYNQDTNKGDQLLKRNVTLHQTGTQSPHLGSRRSKRARIEDEDETKLESSNSQPFAGLENHSTPDNNGIPSSQQREGSVIGQDDQASRPTVVSSTRRRPVAKLSRRTFKSKSPKATDHPHKESNRFAELDLDLQSKIQRIADVETIKWAWEYLSIMRNPTPYVSNKANEDISRQIGSLDTVETSDQRLRELRDHIERDEEIKKSLKVSSRKAQISERLHLAELIGRFIKERDAWKTSPKKRRKPNENRLSPMDRFVNGLFPETMTYKGENISQEKKEKRLAAKEKFARWIRCGEPWAQMVQRFGYGILLVVPHDLSNENLRRLLRPHIEIFLDYIDFTRPGLKDQLSSLSILLPDIVYYGILPPQRLVLETLPYSHLLEVGDRPLEELLQYCTEDKDAMEPADGTVPDSPPEGPDSPLKDPDSPPEDPEKLSPLTRMDSRTSSDSAIDFSEYVDFSTPDVLWAGDCEHRLNTAAIEAKESMIVNSREEYYLSQASHLDNVFLLSPMIDINWEEFLPPSTQ